MKNVLIFFLGVLFATGCNHYERNVPSFKLPEGYSNMKEISGVKIAAHSYQDSAEAKKAFGFDVVGAGLLPIQVVFDNLGANTLEINPSQTFLIDKDNNVWPILEDNLAYERIAKKTELGNVASSAVKPGVLGAAAGAIIGAAVGVVGGGNVGEAVGKGAAAGAAAGATLGGGTEALSKTTEQKISEDLQNRKLRNKKINPQEISYGFLFFPAEAKTPKELRLQLKEGEAGPIHSLSFPLAEKK